LARVERSKSAIADLEAILLYSAAEHGPDVAIAYLLDLDRSIERLADYPELGQVVSRLKGKPRCLRSREHRIYYRFDGTTVFVARVLHKAMDAARWLS
jgi:toxin ParE1/3/4